MTKLFFTDFRLSLHSLSMIQPYIGNVDAFPILSRWQYFNHAGASPWPKRTIQAVADFAQGWGDDCYMSKNWFDALEPVRGSLAKLINAHEDEIAIMRNTGDAICAISSGLHWQKGDRIVSCAAEYPTNVYPWNDVCERHGAELITVPERIDADGVARVSEDDLLDAASHHRTRLIALSHVQWASGQCMDIERVGRFCRERGILFALDIIQSLGVVPVDVKKANVDFAFSGGHKWLMSPPGAGVLYCRRELIERVNPPAVGALSVVNPMKWELNFTRSTTATRFEVGTHAMACIAGMKASVELLLELGVDNIHAQVKSLGDAFAAGIAKKGYIVATPRDREVGGAVCLTSPIHKPDDLVKRMRAEHKTELAARWGRLRFSPHFYNSMDQVERLLDVMPSH
jgi:selenocysteine lyase/cysteine desulfurase